jgi:DNA invertase Pin-like site-specific DNA recombinase
LLTERGIELIAADSPQSFIEDTPTAGLIRQVLGAVSEFDKAMTVAKLRGARDRKRATGVKVEGRKSHAELRSEVVAGKAATAQAAEGRAAVLSPDRGGAVPGGLSERERAGLLGLVD